MEQSEADAGCDSQNDTFTCTVANGLGDPPYHYSDWCVTSGLNWNSGSDFPHYSIHDSSSGQVKLPPRAMSASVDCSRDATNPDWWSGAWVDTYYTVTPYSLSLDISGGLSSGDHIRALVGQKVWASVNADNYQVQPTDTFSWTITGGKPFDDFIASNDSGHYYALWSLYPNNTPSVACYFAKTDPTPSVTCHAILAGQSVTLTDADAIIKAPAVDFDPTIGTVMALPQPNPTRVELVENGYQGVTGDGSHGFDWTGTSVSTPLDYRINFPFPGIETDSGNWSVQQLWTPNRPITYADGGSGVLQTQVAPGLPITALDGSREVADTGYPYYGEWFTADGSQDGDSDSPEANFYSPNDVLYMSADESFRDFLMYVPPGGDSVAVPLRQINWSWHYAANCDNPSHLWTVTAEGQHEDDNATNFPNPFPQWTLYVPVGHLYYFGINGFYP